MKKTVALIVCFVMLMTISVCITSCANPNVDERIVGEWENELSYMHDTYTFNSDGTFVRVEHYGDTYEGEFTAIDGVLTLDFGEQYKKVKHNYKINENENDKDYGDLKIGHNYYERVD